jgi:CRP/FNR family transcriptional regulator, cyclic AMP receptor protein
MDNDLTTFYKGEIIFLEGQTSSCAYIIDSGLVGVYREDPSGKRSLVRKLGKNDMFGEMGLIDKYPRSATTIALQDTRCMIIDRSRFSYLTKFNPHFMITLIKSLTEKLRTTITNLNKIAPAKKNTSSDKTTLSGFFQNKGD